MVDMTDFYNNLLKQNGIETYTPPSSSLPQINALQTLGDTPEDNSLNVKPASPKVDYNSAESLQPSAQQTFNPNAFQQGFQNASLNMQSNPIMSDSMLTALQNLKSNPNALSLPANSSQGDLASRIAQFEGFTPKAQWDNKQYSVGYGTVASSPDESITKDEALKRLNAKLSKAQGYVSKNVDVSKLPQGVVDALVSQTYNMGPGTVAPLYKTAMDCARTGDYAPLAARMKLYNKASGEKNDGLSNRRNKEVSWFMPESTS